MLSYDDALAIMLGYAAALPSETISLDRGGGRVLASALHAYINSPRRAVAAMDGYTLRSDYTASGLSRFHVRGTIMVADPDRGRVERGEPRRIMAGAAMPAGTEMGALRAQPAGEPRLRVRRLPARCR